MFTTIWTMTGAGGSVAYRLDLDLLLSILARYDKGRVWQ
jgi:hypothetical protein